MYEIRTSILRHKRSCCVSKWGHSYRSENNKAHNMVRAETEKRNKFSYVQAYYIIVVTLVIREYVHVYKQ